MKQIHVEKRTEITTQQDADRQNRRFRCEGCSDDVGLPIEDFDIVFRSSKPPWFIKVMR